MKRYIITLMSIFTIGVLVSSAHAANVGVSLGINLGNIPAPVYAAPAPVYAAPPVAIEGEPEFVAPSGLGFYVAVGTPYDLFYAGNRYYLCRGNAWYAGSYYNGPWVQVSYGALPWGLRRYPIARLHYFRNEACRHRGEYGEYGYRHFRPERYEGGREARWDGGRHGGMMGR